MGSSSLTRDWTSGFLHWKCGLLLPGQSVKRSSCEATNPMIWCSSQCLTSVMSCSGWRHLQAPCWVINQCACPDLLTKYPWTDAHGMGAARPRPLRTVYLLRIDYAGDTRKGPAASKGGEWRWEKSWTDPDWRTKLLSSRQKACEPKSSASPIHVCAHLLGLLLNCGFWFSRSWVGPGSLHFLQVPSEALILQIGLWVAKP